MDDIRLSIEVAVPVERVWRALADPAEVVRWDSGVAAALDAPADYPQPGQTVRWRTRSGPFAVLIDRPQEVAPGRHLRALLSLGPYRFDETYTLEPIATGCRLSVEVQTKAALPGVGAAIERFYLGPLSRRDFAAALESIKRLSEAEP